jgi:Uma2 family endonuclease
MRFGHGDRVFTADEFFSHSSADDASELVRLCVRNERLPAEGIGPGWISVAPDLVVEIRSPTETFVELEDKLRDYETAGTTLLWIIDPVARTVTVRSTKGIERMLTLSDTLDVQVASPLTLRNPPERTFLDQPIILLGMLHHQIRQLVLSHSSQ